MKLYKTDSLQTRAQLLSALAIFLLCGPLTGCINDDDNDDSGPVFFDDNVGDDDDDDDDDDYSPWLLNTDGERSLYIYENNSNERVLVNVQSVETTTVDGKTYTLVTATGVPNYETEITASLYDELISRPNVNSDFISGSPSVQIGDIVSFGQDIGYDSSTNCQVGAGFGYWPPGPVCPENVSHEGYFPTEPEPATETCESGLGAQGYWVNGAAIYQWSDGQSVDNIWHTLAPLAETYDVDICSGHAANGEYHHHSYSSCLADLVGDTGDSHSPIYGFTADGYAIYGPWEADGVLAKSSWVTRDYDNPLSNTGCGVAGQRSCLLIDEYDVGRGVTPASNIGPTTSDTYTSGSGNEFETTTGFFYEDYYWDETLSAQGGEYLDQFNGHTDSERGYHYHLTATQDSSGKLTSAFPFTFGPRFAGQLDTQTIVNQCSTTFDF
ncbi:YHYH protein [Microbulbifer sp. SSSA002]|uniref:YHYH protein n=1 Tax=Microbulbifer sp. SSSA002 TaxID=3243376 RepID=UPI004039A6BB